MLLFSTTSITVDGVTVFPDHADPNQFWYLPGPVSLATLPGSDEPQFLLIEYTPDVASTGVKSAGFLKVTVSLKLSDRIRDDLIGQIRAAFPTADNPRLSPVPFDGGSVQIVALDLRGGGGTSNTAPAGTFEAVEYILGAVSPELFGDNDALFALPLSEDGASILKTALEGGTASVGAIYNLKFTGVRPALDAKVTADLKRLYDSFSVGVSAKASWVTDGIDTTLEKLRRDGAIKVEIVNPADDQADAEKEAEAFAIFKDQILSTWFTPSLTPATAAAADAGTPTVPGTSTTPTTTAPSAAGQTAGVANALAGAASAASSAASSFGLAVKLKFVNQDEFKTVTFDYSRMGTVQRTYAPQGYFPLLLSNLDKNKHFLEVDSTDPFLSELSIAISPPKDFAGVAPHPQAVPEIDKAEYRVWYGTNRRPNDPNDAGKGYSVRRDTVVHYGSCRVFIPQSHKIGSIGSPWWKRLLMMNDDRLRLLWIDELQQRAYWAGIASQLAAIDADDCCALIFVHGYNVSFQEAALRAAQIGFDLSVKGAMAFFSWPSQGSTRRYSADEATIEASEGVIADFMTDFAERSDAAAVHIIAHSMGNRGVLRAVNRIAARAQRGSGKPFGQIILAAADVDADVFRQLSAAYAEVASRTTLYVSKRDLAVEASRWLHNFPRAGLMPPTLVLPGIDTINVTNVDLTMLGHGYVAEARDVLIDMHALITHSAPPNERFGLREAKNEEGQRYWLIGA